MTTNEFRKIIASSKQPTWFNSIEILINYSKINFSQKLVGISSIHKFLSQQIDGWNKYENLPKELEFSKKHFTQLKLRIENFVNSRQSDEIANLNSYWRGEQNQLQSYDLNNPFFTYDSPQTEFLIDVYNNFPDSFIGAFLFTIGQHRTNNKNELIGAILAYEFELKDYTELVQRRNKEKSSISKVRNDLREQLNESETQLSK